MGCGESTIRCMRVPRFCTKAIPDPPGPPIYCFSIEVQDHYTSELPGLIRIDPPYRLSVTGTSAGNIASATAARLLSSFGDVQSNGTSNLAHLKI